MTEDPRRPHPASSLSAALDGAERGGAPSSRNAQIASLILRVLQERLLRGMNDPRVQGMVSIVGVDLSPDATHARVRISVLPADRGRLTLSGLVSGTRHLEGVVRKATRLRRVPRLVFEIDDSMKREAALYSALQQVAQTDQPEVASDDAADDSYDDRGDDHGEKIPHTDGFSPTTA